MLQLERRKGGRGGPCLLNIGDVKFWLSRFDTLISALGPIKYARILLFQFVFTKYVIGFRNYDGFFCVVIDLFTILGLLFSSPLFIVLPPLLFLLSLWHALNKAALPVVYFDQLLGHAAR